MEATRLAPTVGIVASLAVLVVLVIPYLVVDATGSVGAYYAVGSGNALAVGLFAIISIIVLAAGREGRSSPDVVSGAALVLGLFMVTMATLWAVTIPTGFVAQMTTETLLQYHSGALVVVSALVPLSAAWYARALRIF